MELQINYRPYRNVPPAVKFVLEVFCAIGEPESGSNTFAAFKAYDSSMQIGRAVNFERCKSGKIPLLNYRGR